MNEFYTVPFRFLRLAPNGPKLSGEWPPEGRTRVR